MSYPLIFSPNNVVNTFDNQTINGIKTFDDIPRGVGNRPNIDTQFMEKQFVKETIDADATYYVGSGGDYTTLSAALHDLSKKHPIYMSDNTNPQVSLILKSGFVLEENIRIENQNLNWITISSEDATVPVDYTKISYSIVMYFINTIGPVIETKFVCNAGDTSHDGLRLDFYSYVVIRSGGGFTNFGNNNVYMYNSGLRAYTNVDFSGAGNFNISCRGCSFFHGVDITCQNAGDYAVYVEGCSNCKISDINCNGSSYGVVLTNQANFACTGTCTFNNCTSTVIKVHGNSNCYLDPNTEIKNCTGSYGIFAEENSSVVADSVDMSGSTFERCIYCRFGSRVSARSMIANGVGTLYGAIAYYSSYIDVSSANMQMGASPNPNDIAIRYGSMITAFVATGGISHTANTLVADGIIFQ